MMVWWRSTWVTARSWRCHGSRRGHGDVMRGGDGGGFRWVLLCFWVFVVTLVFFFFLIWVFVLVGFWWAVDSGGHGRGVVVVTRQ